MAKFTTIPIDDEPIARTRLRRLLSNYGELFQIIAEAKNGVEGLEMIQRLKPDLIFLDIQMPGKTGFEMLNELDEFPLLFSARLMKNMPCRPLTHWHWTTWSNLLNRKGYN